MNNIEILEKFVEIFKLSQRSVDKLDRENYGEIIGVEEIEAIEKLIQENKELKEKIKELEYKIEIKKYCKFDVITNLKYYKNLAEEYQENSIPKSKVKEKISYLQSLEFEDKLVSQWVANATTISILQELLEEGE